jgi:hypothetical protein
MLLVSCGKIRKWAKAAIGIRIKITKQVLIIIFLSLFINIESSGFAANAAGFAKTGNLDSVSPTCVAPKHLVI